MYWDVLDIEGGYVKYLSILQVPLNVGGGGRVVGLFHMCR